MATKKQKIEIVRTEVFPRFIHVVTPASGASVFHLQAAADNGKLRTEKCTRDIYLAVLGKIKGTDGEFRDLGLRKLVQVKFRAHFDKGDTVIAVDVVPKRAFVRGAAPKEYGEALEKGFEVDWREDISGFEVKGTHSGLSEKDLYDILDHIRNHQWGTKSSSTFNDHRIDKLEANKYRVKLLSTRSYMQ